MHTHYWRILGICSNQRIQVLALSLLTAGSLYGSESLCTFRPHSAAPVPEELSSCSALQWEEEANGAEPVWPNGAESQAVTFGGAQAFAKNVVQNQGEFIRHDVDSLATPKLLGFNTTGFTALEISQDLSTLYVVEYPNNLFGTLSKEDGSFTAINEMPLPEGHLWSSLMTDPRDGTLYGVSLGAAPFTTSTLFTVDPSTGSATAVAPIGVGLLGASINCQGEMYGITTTDDSLYRVDLESGAETLIGPLGFNINFAQDIDFDNSTGILYHWMYDEDVLNGRYGTIDLITGAFSMINFLPINDSYEGTTATQCPADIFVDGFESGDLSAWQ